MLLHVFYKFTKFYFTLSLSYLPVNNRASSSALSIPFSPLFSPRPRPARPPARLVFLSRQSLALAAPLPLVAGAAAIQSGTSLRKDLQACRAAPRLA